MKIDPVLLAYIIAQALLAAQRALDAFMAINGREPTLAEWKALEGAWKSPDEIEAEVKAQLSGGGASPAPPAT